MTEELKTSDMESQSICIIYPPLLPGVSFVLKSRLIHNLPTFHGLNGQDPKKYLFEFHTICASMKPRDVFEEQMKLQVFPFSLKAKLLIDIIIHHRVASLHGPL
ncbi:hypothetical protein vseg_003557 [Gypsophila vaccaria]